MSHEEIARRLREQGITPAPPDLRDQVMRTVRAEPRPAPRRRPRLALPRWRPVAVWAVAGACLLAAGAGLTRLGGNGASHGSGSAARMAAPSGLAGAATRGVVATTKTFVFRSPAQARLVLGSVLFRDLRPGHGAYYGSVTASQLGKIEARYEPAAEAGRPASTSGNSHAAARIRVLLRVRKP